MFRFQEFPITMSVIFLDRCKLYELVNKKLRHNSQYDIIGKIGSVSKNADIYLCRCENQFFVRKTYKKRSSLDIILSLKLSSLVLRDVNPHFNVIYRLQHNTLLCELAKGDLKSFLKEYILFDVLKNCLQQILVCVLSFHVHCEMMHSDCNPGNFLYKRIPKGGHIHYSICGKDVYIENLGYLWMINDYDLVEEADATEYYCDYGNALEVFVEYKKKCKKFSKILEETLHILRNNHNDYDLFLKLIDAKVFDTCNRDVLNNNRYIL